MISFPYVSLRFPLRDCGLFIVWKWNQHTPNQVHLLIHFFLASYNFLCYKLYKIVDFIHTCFKENFIEYGRL
jgi:hypothetical protein